MRLELVPLLKVQRELYDMPRDMARFRAYLQRMTGGTDDAQFLPLGLMNPMGKEKARETFDHLLGMDAEGIAARALGDAERRLTAVEGHFRVGLTVGDDVEGMWTHRDLGSAHGLMDLSAAIKRRWIAAAFYTSEATRLTPETVRREVLVATYRTLHQVRFGRPRTLEDVRVQEGRALAFAGASPTLALSALEHVEAIAAMNGASDTFGAIYAWLYGDEAAREAGYPALGVPARGGFDAALAMAQREGVAPETWLLTPRGG